MKYLIFILFLTYLCSCNNGENNKKSMNMAPEYNFQITNFNDTLNTRKLALRKDSVTPKEIERKTKIANYTLKGRLKLSKRKSNKSREFGGVYIDESILFRTR